VIFILMNLSTAIILLDFSGVQYTFLNVNNIYCPTADDVVINQQQQQQRCDANFEAADEVCTQSTNNRSEVKETDDLSNATASEVEEENGMHRNHHSTTDRLDCSQATATASDDRNKQDPKSIEGNDYERMYELQHSLNRNPVEFIPAAAAAAADESILC